MTRLSPLSIAMPLLLAVVVPMNAQAPDPRPIIARPSIQTAKLEANSNIPNGILPAQYKAAYGFNRIPNQGQGQTIALVDAYDDPNISSDLAFYANYFHLTPCNFQKVKVGNPAQGEDWDLVESWDVEQACAIAPQANIILVEANTDSLADLFQAVAVASAAPYNAAVVSMSWMTDEFAGEQQFDSYLCNIVNGNGQPVTFVAASNSVKYPAASPCVVAAGQTTVTLSTVRAPACQSLAIELRKRKRLGLWRNQPLRVATFLAKSCLQWLFSNEPLLAGCCSECRKRSRVRHLQLRRLGRGRRPGAFAASLECVLHPGEFGPRRSAKEHAQPGGSGHVRDLLFFRLPHRFP
jgi:hypothetical protein